jgi:hypothetical protein
VVLASEFIVSLQIVGLNRNGLRLGMAAEVDSCWDRRWSAALLLAQQEGHRRGTRGIALQRFADGAG